MFGKRSTGGGASPQDSETPLLGDGSSNLPKPTQKTAAPTPQQKQPTKPATRPAGGAAGAGGASGAAPRAAKPAAPAPKPAPEPGMEHKSDDYYEIKTTIFNALIDTIDLAQLAQLDAESARDEIRDIVNEIIAIKSVVMSIAEQESLLQDICNDVLGYGSA